MKLEVQTKDDHLDC